MNGYELSREWYNHKFKNPRKVKAGHSDMFFYIVDLWNRLGQKKEFGLPTSVTMEVLGIGSYNTYKKILNDLFDFGFIKLISDSKNQHQSKVIALSKIDKATDKALDKATAIASDEPLDKPLDSIIELENKGTKEPEKEIRAFEFFKVNHPLLYEQSFLMKYSKKIKDKEDFVEAFNNKLDTEDLEWTGRKLSGRIGNFATYWIKNQDKFNGNQTESKPCKIPIG